MHSTTRRQGRRYQARSGYTPSKSIRPNIRLNGGHGRPPSGNIQVIFQVCERKKNITVSLFWFLLQMRRVARRAATNRRAAAAGRPPPVTKSSTDPRHRPLACDGRVRCTLCCRIRTDSPSSVATFGLRHRSTPRCLTSCSPAKD